MRTQSESRKDAALLRDSVAAICKEFDLDYMFVTEGASVWSVSHDEHIRKVAKYHKEMEEMPRETGQAQRL